jgi:hypothetical protein
MMSLHSRSNGNPRYARGSPCGQPLAGVVALLQSAKGTVFDPEGVAQSQRGVAREGYPSHSPDAIGTTVTQPLESLQIEMRLRNSDA